MHEKKERNHQRYKQTNEGTNERTTQEPKQWKNKGGINGGIQACRPPHLSQSDASTPRWAPADRGPDTPGWRCCPRWPSRPGIYWWFWQALGRGEKHKHKYNKWIFMDLIHGGKANNIIINNTLKFPWLNNVGVVNLKWPSDVLEMIRFDAVSRLIDFSSPCMYLQHGSPPQQCHGLKDRCNFISLPRQEDWGGTARRRCQVSVLDLLASSAKMCLCADVTLKSSHRHWYKSLKTAPLFGLVLYSGH